MILKATGGFDSSRRLFLLWQDHRMVVDVVMSPRDLRPEHREGVIVVLDVLRATTSMLAALAVGVTEIRIFEELESAAKAAEACKTPRLLCGERNAIRPAGFDLGNSPSEFSVERCRGQTLFMTTTNGTRAILAAHGAEVILIGALVNARAVAEALARTAGPMTLLCSGTEGEIATEDVLGAGAIIDRLQSIHPIDLASDAAWIAWQLFRAKRDDLASALRVSRGGRNVIRAGLAGDIDFAANLDSLSVVGTAGGQPPIVTLHQSSA